MNPLDHNEVPEGWDQADDISSEASRQTYLEDRDSWMQSRVAHHADLVPF